MRYVVISEARPGMTLAKNVYDSYNRLLLAEHQTLTSEYINKLYLWGYPGFYIHDDMSDGIEVAESISMELRNQGVEALRKQSIDMTMNVAKNIVDQILSNRNTTLDMVDLRTFDDYTYRHSVNVAVLSTILGMGLGLKRDELEELCVGAIFHDMGKLMIDSKVLNKPARLTPEEFAEVKKHPQLSLDFIKKKVKIAENSKLAVLHHHENQDGSGYPGGLAGEEIPWYSRIIHVADVYDALTSKRPYKEPYTPSEAIEYLMGGCNILFDDKVVRAFLKCVPVYPKGATIILSDNRKAVVEENNYNPLRPKVRLENGETIDLSDVSSNLNLTINPSTVVENNFSEQLDNFDIGKAQEVDDRKTIIMIDSMMDDLQTVKETLDQKYKVMLMRSGEAALDYLEKHERPALVMLDILLPGMNGMAVARIIREKYGESLPVIFLTSVSNRESVELSRTLKITDYILKPFRPTYIKERVDIAIEGYGSED